MQRVFSDSIALRGHWFAVALSSDIGENPCQRTLLGEKCVIWRDANDVIVAAPDRCPHREAPLSAGSVIDGCLTCRYHGWSFGESGRCVSVPSAADSVPVPPTAHLDTVSSIEIYGLVWLCLGEPVSDVPGFRWEEDPAFRRINNPLEVWQTSAMRMTDNFLDISHFPWVHTGTFGNDLDPEVPKIDLASLDDEFYGYSYDVEVNNPDGAAITTGISQPMVKRHMSTGFSLPFTVRSTILYETGLEHIILLLSAPLDDVTSYFTFVIWRNDDFSVPADDVVAFDRAIGAEDKLMLELLDGVLPLDRGGVVSVQADKASLEWRRRFSEMIELAG